MANLLWGFQGTALRIEWLAPFQTTGLFPEARVVDSTGALVTTVDLTANGTIAYLYEGSWTPAVDGQYVIVIDVYTNVGQTTLHESFDSTTIDVRVRDIGGGFRGGSVGGLRGKLTKEELERLGKIVAREVWDRALKGGQTAEATLLAKSEFKPDEQVVHLNESFPSVIEISNGLSAELGKTEERLIESFMVSHRQILAEILTLPRKDQVEAIKKTLEDHYSEQSRLLRDFMIDLNSIDDLIRQFDLPRVIKGIQSLGQMVGAMDKGVFPLLNETKTILDKLVDTLQTHGSMMEVMNQREAKRFAKFQGDILQILTASVKRIMTIQQMKMVREVEVVI